MEKGTARRIATGGSDGTSIKTRGETCIMTNIMIGLREDKVRIEAPDGAVFYATPAAFVGNFMRPNNIAMKGTPIFRSVDWSNGVKYIFDVQAYFDSGGLWANLPANLRRDVEQPANQRQPEAHTTAAKRTRA